MQKSLFRLEPIKHSIRPRAMVRPASRRHPLHGNPAFAGIVGCSLGTRRVGLGVGIAAFTMNAAQERRRKRLPRSAPRERPGGGPRR